MMVTDFKGGGAPCFVSVIKETQPFVVTGFPNYFADFWSSQIAQRCYYLALGALGVVAVLRPAGAAALAAEAALTAAAGAALTTPALPAAILRANRAFFFRIAVLCFVFRVRRLSPLPMISHPFWF
jgi:hypothetical protein